MNSMKSLMLLLPGLLLFVFLPTTHAKSSIEPCSSSDSCLSLLSYILPVDSKLSEISYRFQVNLSDVAAANSLNLTTPSLSNQILHAKSLVKIPISCSCVDGIRRSVSTTYTVRPADTVDSISESYGGLVSASQIRSSNGINANNPLTSGQTLVIPFPCTCFNNSYKGVPTVYMSHVVQSGENLSNLATEFGTTITDLESVNGLGQPEVDSGDILAIPIPACSSANLNWYNDSLLIATGCYALTANNCIKCICGTRDLNLQCLPSGIEVSCSHLQCKGSDLFIGDTVVKHTKTGCSISACVYRGHSGHKIFRSIVNSSQVQCPANQSYISMPPAGSPSPFNPTVPHITISPSASPWQSPFPAPNPKVGSNGSNSPRKQNSNAFNHQGSGSINHVVLSYCVLLVFSFFL